MKKSDFMKKVIEEYTKTGYRVLAAPGPEQLPEGISNLHIDLIARNDKENVVVQVKQRDELVDLDDTRQLAERVEATPGWRFHLVAGPAANGDGEVPEYGTELDSQRIQQLVDEAEAGLATGALRSAFLVAWAAAEASMR